MNDEPMMIDETEESSAYPRSTARTWKKARLVVPAMAALLTAAIVVASQWSVNMGGTTAAQIAEFRQAVDEYFAEAQRQGMTEVTMRSYDPLEATEDGQTVETLNDIDLKRQRVQEIAERMGYENKRKAEALFRHEARLYTNGALTDKEMAEAVVAERKEWKMRSIFGGVGRAVSEAVLAAVIAFVVVWLVVRACEGVWWFLVDRLQDLVNAVRRP
jgi:hypothetical protein